MERNAQRRKLYKGIKRKKLNKPNNTHGIPKQELEKSNYQRQPTRRNKQSDKYIKKYKEKNTKITNEVIYLEKHMQKNTKREK